MRVQYRLSRLQLGKDIRRIDDLVRKIGIRVNAIPHLCERTKNHRCINGLGAKLITDKDKRQQEKEGIYSHYQIREGIRVTTDKGIDDDGQTGNRTNDKMAGH